MSFFVVYPVEICYDEEDKRNGSGVPTEETEDETGDYGYPMDNLFADYM